MKYVYSILALVLTSVVSFCQNEAPEIPPKLIPDYHFNLSYTAVSNTAIQHAEIGLNKDLFTLMSNKVRLGLGLRAGIQDNKDISFTSAHGAIKGNANHHDTLFHSRVQSAAFNLYFNGEYHLSKHVAFGLNLDLLGITTGLSTDANYIPGSTSEEYGYYAVEDVESIPTAANAFSFGDSKGGLNTQLYVKLALSRKVAFRAGVSYLFQEYSTELGYGAFKSYRYEYNTIGYHVGFTFNRFNEK